ncbi:hypothetical protein ACQPZU_09040 [Saccharomonospora azurea]|uniref:hypothetical protein n=1 Tax=Saccharomonospora azurea TaxID=40988 RepID=UPI000240082D|nr:hypothetical protein [Saccharomonospora azurea]EHK85319.1 hypothetical protein SZMC14600_16361 [Saccharomonospora azurea SZMC 14600]
MTHTSKGDTATVRAVGKLTEALEVVEEARGHLYAFHRLTGTADFALEEAIGMLRDAGYDDLAARLDTELLGRNVLPGRWTYQVVEDYEDTYYTVFREFVDEARQLTPGQRHAYEAELKRTRRTRGHAGHEAEPRDVAGGENSRTATDRSVASSTSR